MAKPLGITEVVLRDGHQSLLATRLRIEDMLPICAKLDRVGYWSLETWGGATFDACIRYLGEDPWERLRQLKKAMPKTPQQMLLRGQNLLGYRHYADDVVESFVERCAHNGIDVFRIFDALNDLRNLDKAVKASSPPANTPKPPFPIRPARSILSICTWTWPSAWKTWAAIPSLSKTWPACSSLTRRKSWCAS